MLSLTEKPRSTYIYQGHEYQLNLAFDNVLRFYQLLDDDHFSAAEKAGVAFEMFFGQPTNDTDLIVQAFANIADFLAQDPYDTNPTPEVDLTGAPIKPLAYYSFEQDAGAIYASFVEQYGINLIKEQGKMQWDEFKALFAGLGPKTYFQRIVSIRQADPNDYEGKERVELIEAQNRYALAENHSEEAVQAQLAGFADALKGWAQS